MLRDHDFSLCTYYLTLKTVHMKSIDIIKLITAIILLIIAIITLVVVVIKVFDGTL